MKYRTKLYIALVSISCLSTFLALSVVYLESKRQFFREIRSNLLSIASTTAALVDGALLKNIHSQEDETSPGYIAFRDQLRKARVVNQRDDIYVRYIYTLKPSPTHPDELIYLVDTSTVPSDIAHVGEIDTAHQDLIGHLNEYYSPPFFVKDRWGLWLSGFAPILDQEGKYIATVGVNVEGSLVLFELNKLISDGLWGLAAAFFLALIGAFFLSRQVTQPLSSLCHCVDEIGKGNLNCRTELHTQDEFNDLALAIDHMAKGLKEKEKLKAGFARYVSNYVLEKILASDRPLKLEGERKKITVLFSDIRQFSLLAEKLPPEKVVALLNEYFEIMLDVIFKNYGTLDKFIGDGLMAEFGAPLEDPLQEKNAVQTAIDMQKQLSVLSQKWEKEGHPPIHMGIGVHTGIAVVGDIGSQRRMEYTAIGNTVNIASRLEQATKILKTPILISETTYLAIKEDFKFQNLGLIDLPGKTDKINVYTVIL